MNLKEHLWVEKYRPDTLDLFVGNPHLVDLIQPMLSDASLLGNILLYGKAGGGKTTLAKIIANSHNCDILYLNASDNNNIDTVREVIKNFVIPMSLRDFKIVLLDEFDGFTPQAQGALRNIIEEYSDSSRFIMTANYIEKIMEPIQSRLQKIEVISPEKSVVAKHLAFILNKENVSFTVPDVVKLVDTHYPDIREIINEAQLYSKSGALTLPTVIGSHNFSEFLVSTFTEKGSVKEKFTSIRQKIADERIRTFVDLYAALYDNLDTCFSKNIGDAILIIADGESKDPFVINKEIIFMSTIHQLLNLKA